MMLSKLTEYEENFETDKDQRSFVLKQNKNKQGLSEQCQAQAKLS